MRRKTRLELTTTNENKKGFVDMSITSAVRLASIALATTAAIGTTISATVPASAAALNQQVNGTHFDIKGDVSRVTGNETFTKGQFTLTDVTLYDTACDNRQAQFMVGQPPQEVTYKDTVGGCNTSQHWAKLSWDASGARFIQIATQACNNSSCSSRYSQNFYPS